MRKLKLDLDSLTVQTFETYEAAEKQGTVQAHDQSTTGGTFLCPYICDTEGGATCREVECLRG